MTEPETALTPHQIDPLAAAEVSGDLRAAVAARRELGAETEDQVIDTFLARVESRIDARVDQRLQQSLPSRAGAGRRKGKKLSPEGMMGTSLGTGIPLTIVGGIFGGAAGITAVMACVFLLNLLYLWHDFLTRD